MFIYCYDEKLKRELLAKGFKMAEFSGDTNNKVSVFYDSKKLGFDFSKYSNGEFQVKSKLNF